MSARLVPLDPEAATPILIQQPVLLVGRHPEADIRIGSPLISRRHCCLAVVYDRVLIRDLGSRHGIHVNGVRVEEAQIRPGDEVAIAHLIYRFDTLAPAIRPRPPVLADPGLEIDDEGLIPLDD